MSHVPFKYSGKQDFPVKLAQWIGEVFYDLLPEHVYEVREEQIYTAYQIADSVCKGKVHFAEAGVGTGKTFAYLLAAIAFARFRKKPAIIACASTALQEQLAGPGGDIEKLSHLLGLEIDARMAKDPRQYICDLKVDQSYFFIDEQSEQLDAILQWAETTKRGERSEMPNIPDRVWARVAWDEAMSCEICRRQGYCKLVKAREHYRGAADLIVCDHGSFFADLWTREERKLDGKRPLLPDYSVLIFDEGHKILLPAALRVGRSVVKNDIERILPTLERIQGARMSLLSSALAMEKASRKFFELLYNSTIEDERTDRLTVEISDELLKAANTFKRTLEGFQFELQNEQGLYFQSLSDMQMQAYETRVERATVALSRFCRQGGKDVIVWAERSEQAFWVVPRELGTMLNRQLFTKGLPVVFSSATLSTGGDYSYLARTLGLQEYTSSSVGSPFNYQEQAVVYLPQQIATADQEKQFAQNLKQLVSLLRLAKGRALVLTNSPSELQKIRQGLKDYSLPYQFLWEDRAERGYLIRKFKEDISSVLVGSGFWEGIDVPGEALTLLVIWQLPFPPQDPLIEAQRREVQNQGLDPFTEVDIPQMALRLKQGCGRLIRTQQDRGAIALIEPIKGTPWEQVVLAVLPEGAELVHDLESLATCFS